MKYRIIIKTITLFALGLSASGCVSDTLSQQNTQPQPLATNASASYDPAQREQAIAEIRAKAENANSGELTNAYATNDGPTTPLTAEEQAAKIAELERNAATNQTTVTDAELASKQRSINDLRNKAKSHYNNAINSIAN